MKGPVLLLDAGNSRLKWALVEAEAVLCEGVADYDTLEPFAVALLAHAPASRALGCNVAGSSVAHMLEELLAPVPVDWLKATAERAGVKSAYREPGQLGADRWAAMIGARQIVTSDVIVVMAGTAMTVDALTADGEFLGGLIVPGLTLMRQALAKGTADLGHPEGDPVPFPRSTGEAIVNGALLALVGAIEQMRLRLIARRHAEVAVLLSGGDAGRLQPLLAPTLAEGLQCVDNLVLRGLRRLAYS
jgi:type III pantothenate kinase